MTSTKLTTQCAECKAELRNGSNLCCQCGSDEKHHQLNIAETIDTHDLLDAKVKDHSLRSDDKLRVHLIAGDDQRKSDGRWMNKERLIDRNNNRYIETVTDPITGEVLHQCDEPLSDHWGHGSAKDLED